MKEINVLGQRIKIKRVSGDTLSKNHGDDSENVHGIYSGTDRTISLATELTGDTFRRILLHEIFHAHLGVSGLSSAIDSSKLEEALCDMTESYIHLFKDKQFVELMNGGATNKVGVDK